MRRGPRVVFSPVRASRRAALSAVTFVLALAITLAAAGCSNTELPPGYPGTPAPLFTAPDLEGYDRPLDGFRGEVVLLNLWATWCPPCRVEMPHLQLLHEEFRDEGLRVIGVSVDSEGASRTVERFLDDTGVDFLILRDPAERTPHLYRAIGLPLTVLIDREGIVRWRHAGPVTSDDPRLRGALEELLAEGPWEPAPEAARLTPDQDSSSSGSIHSSRASALIRYHSGCTPGMEYSMLIQRG